MATQSNYTILVDAQIQNLQNIQKQLNDLHSQINVNVNAQGLSETTRQTQSLAQASDKANTAAGELILTYQVANQIFHTSVEAISSMVEQVYELDGAITEFKKVSDLQGQSLSKYVDNLSQMGLQVARTGSEMVMAAGQFRKSGFNDKDAAMLASVAAQFQNIADTSVSAEDAASSIVSQIRAFGWGAEEATHIIDAYNEVANHFSVGTGDLSKALEVGSAGMATYGNSFEEIIGLVTAGTEIMTGRSAQVSRGLMTIAANIANNADALKAYGIEVANQDGSLRSTYDVLKDLSEIWGTMTDTERVALGQVLAGKNQFKVLTSVLQNFSHAIEATETAYNSAGSAARENAKYMESLEAKTTNLKATFQDLANNVISKELVGAVLDLTNGLAELANTGIGQIITKTALFAGTGFGISQLLQVTKVLPTLAAQFNNFEKILTGVAHYGDTIGKTVLTFGSTALPILLAAGVALFTIVEAVKAIKRYSDEHSLEGIAKRFQDETEYVKEYTDKLDECKKKLEELNAVEVKDRGQEWAREKAYVEEQTRYYEYLLNLHQKEQQAAIEEYRQKDKPVGYSVGSTYTDSMIYAGGMQAIGTREDESLFSQQQLDALNQTYQNEADAIWALAEAFEYTTDITDDAEAALEDLRQQLIAGGISLQEITVSADEYNRIQTEAIQTYLNATSGLQDLTAAQKERQLSLLENNKTIFDTIVASDNLKESEKSLKQAYIDLMDSSGTLNQYLVDVANTLGISIVQAAARIGGSFDIILDDFVRLEDGTWTLKSSLDGTADAITDIANASYTGSDAAFQMAQNLLTAANQVDTTSRAFYDLVAQEIIFNNTGINVSQQIAALQALALQAGIAAYAIASVTNPEASIARAGQSSGYISQIDEDGNLVTTKIDQNASKQWALQQYYQNLMAQTHQGSAPTYTPPPTSSGGGSVQKAKDEIEKNAQSTLNNISSMTSQTIDDAAKEAQEKAKKTLDAIKKAVKEFYDERINALKEQNEEIDKQVQLEEKLKALEEAKNKQILLYENGEYHYGQDLGAIAAAQKDYDKFVADMERDEQIEVLEDTRDKILKVLEQIESNLENYTETQLSSIGNLSTSVTSSIENITNIVGNTSSGIFAALQGLLSGSGSSGSLDLSALMSLLGGGSSGSFTSPISSHLTGENLLAGTYEELVAHGGNVGYKLREAWGQTISQDEIDRLMRLRLSGERDWKQGQLLSLAYKADTDIPLDVQWWMSIFEAEMSDIIRGYTGNIGGGADPRGLDPDAAKHVDINYWLDAIKNAKDMYEAMDYYARAVASGYVLAEFANGYFDALGYKNFDPKTIKQDMRNAYSHMYINNPDAVLMTRFKQYYSDPQLARGNAAESAWYFNQNDFLNDLLYSQLTAEQVWKYGGDTARSAYYNLEGKPLSEAESWQQENAEAIAARNRQYLLDELYKQIELNSAAWFEATEAEKDAYHRANEYYRDIVNRIESGDYEGLGGWLPSAASPYMQGILNDQNGKGKHYDSVIDYINSPGQSYTGDVVMIRNGEVIAPAKDVIPEIAESLGIPTDYGTTTGIAAQGSMLEDLGSNGTTNYNINIDNIELPGVVDSNGFITGLRNLAYQYAYTRQ